CQPVVHVVSAPCRDIDQGTQIGGHRIGPTRLALDEAGIAVAGLQTRLLAVDQRNGPAAALQMHRRRHSHHPAAKNDRAFHCLTTRCDAYEAGATPGANRSSVVLMVAAMTTAIAVITTRKPKAASKEPVPVAIKPMAAGATKPALWPPKLIMPT